MNEKRLLSIAIAVSLVVGMISGTVAGVVAPVFLRQSAFGWLAPQRGAPPSGFVLPPRESPAAAGTSTEALVAEDRLTVDVVKQVSPAVVSIVITKELSNLLDPFDDFFHDPFFSPPPRPRAEPGPKERRQVGGGSGFFVSADGLVVTNKHVVADEDAEYTVVMQDGRRLPAKVLAADPVLDLAVIRVEGSGFPHVALGDSDRLVVGQTVIAIGYALAEFRNTVTKGVVSGINRRIVAGGRSGTEVIEEAIQTDAAINPGNSGGPLLDLHGRVVGVNTAVSQDGQSLGFALPVNVAKRAIESVQKHGRIIRPWLGVRYLQLNEDIAKKNSLSYTDGALVVRGESPTDLAVSPGSPADKAGIVENDIILEINGQILDEEHTLSSVLGRFGPGDKITLKIVHQGKEKTVEVTLAERK